MTPATPHRPGPPSRFALRRAGPTAQRGIALIVGLIILAVLSLIGIAAFSISTQEERMAGNSRDRMLAFEAAEAALRGCENFVKSNGGLGVFVAAPGTFPGMYQGPSSSTGLPITETAPAQSEAWWHDNTKTLQVPVPNSSAASAPSCVAESIALYPNAGYTRGNPLNSANAANVAHITAHGYGKNSNTVVRLESYYSL